MTNKYKIINLSVPVVCFTIVWAINELLLTQFSIEDQPYLSMTIKLAAAIGIYALLFELLMFWSITYSDKWWSEEARIVGDWYQIFQIHNYEKSSSKVDSIRHGPVSISVVNNMLEISATNNKPHEQRSPSNWYSDKVSIQGSQVWLLFASTGPGRGETHGNMRFHVQGKRPQNLMGQFSDSSPARHYGSIELFKSKEEYERRLALLLDGES